MNPRSTKNTAVETEGHLLRTIRDLISALSIEHAAAICHADPRLAGRVGPMIKGIGEVLGDRVMTGQLDLMTATIETIEHEIGRAVTLAASRLTGPGRTAPGSADPLPSA